MLQIVVPETEFFDERTQTFVTTKKQVLRLEHSLVSISKWESKWKKPFLEKSNNRSNEETIDYIRCMTITQNVDPLVYNGLTRENYDSIARYIDDSMTATTFSDKSKSPSREIVTSELIYYWMIAAGIPLECEKWHLNRLLTLIRICGIKNQPPKKRNRRDIMRRNSSLNASRRARLGTKG